MGTDARVRYTKMVIKNSFVSLLKTKPLNKVTVKEICELSEINRATFYKYYCDPYDLMDKLKEEFLDNLLSMTKDTKYYNFKDLFTLILKSLKSDSELYITLFSENGDKYFADRVLDICCQIKTTEVKSLTSERSKWLFYFAAQGCSGILTQWLKGGMTEPISDVADFADSLMQKIFEIF